MSFLFRWRQAAVSQRLNYVSCWGGWGKHSSQRALRRFTQWPSIEHPTLQLRGGLTMDWGAFASQVSVSKHPDFKTNTWVLLHIGFDSDFWVNIASICSLHTQLCFSRLAYQSRASKHKLNRVRPFKTLFQSNKEELEILNSHQNFVFINKVPPLRRCRPKPRPPLDPPCYATVYKWFSGILIRKMSNNYTIKINLSGNAGINV